MMMVWSSYGIRLFVFIWWLFFSRCIPLYRRIFPCKRSQNVLQNPCHDERERTKKRCSVFNFMTPYLPLYAEKQKNRVMSFVHFLLHSSLFRFFWFWESTVRTVSFVCYARIRKKGTKLNWNINFWCIQLIHWTQRTQRNCIIWWIIWFSLNCVNCRKAMWKWHAMPKTQTDFNYHFINSNRYNDLMNGRAWMVGMKFD